LSHVCSSYAGTGPFRRIERGGGRTVSYPISSLFFHSAEVIKIENPKGGDDTRAWGPPFAKNLDPSDPAQESAYFLGVNRNKKSITVNLRSEEGKQLIHDLVKKVDVLVENYVPGKLDEMGLGYKELSALNPRLVYTSITGKEKKKKKH